MDIGRDAMKRIRRLGEDEPLEGAFGLRVAVLLGAILMLGLVARGQSQPPTTNPGIDVLSVVESEGFPAGRGQFLIVAKVAVVALAVSPETADVKKLDWKADFAILDAAGQPLTAPRSRSFEVTAAPSNLRTTWKLLGEAPARWFVSRLDALPEGKRVTVETPGVIVCAWFVPALSPDKTWIRGDGAGVQDRVYFIVDAPLDELRSYTLSLKSGPPVPFAPAIARGGTPPPATTTPSTSPPPTTVATTSPPLPAVPAPVVPKTSTSGSTLPPTPTPLPTIAPSPSPATTPANVVSRPYALPPVAKTISTPQAEFDLLGVGGRGNLARFDEAYALIHAGTPDYALALHLLRQNLQDNPRASDLDYDLGWAMFAAAKTGEWESAADYYEILRRQFSGDVDTGADGAVRNWEDLMTEAKNLARSAATTKSRQAFQRMGAADRARPTTRQP